MTLTNEPNRLISETSPYLLQHARNPVDWYPWGEEAFERARQEDKPVFLSVGYSSCHWCHVMERESFTDPEVAEALNRGFIPVKVDREERPDVDHVYMLACMAMTGSGGWPLSVFLTPAKKPFFAGTYFPKYDHGGRAGFLTLLANISHSWRHGRKKLETSAERILAHIREDPGGTAGSRGGARPDQASVRPSLARETAGALMPRYDARWGGFGPAPKFPSPHTLMFLMRKAYAEAMDSPVWSAVRHTLAAMAAGGLRDHVGGGFCRYSTDRMWLVPHFEKMLYDNALLCMAYTECYEKTGEFAPVVREIIAYLSREMAAPGGGFYTAQDAESEGVEGLYYCWTPAQVKAVLGDGDGQRFCFLYDITAGGNFEGMNIPNLIRMPLGGDDMVFASIALPKLLEARSRRVPPLRDDKILLTGSALTAAALAKAGRALEEPSYTRDAERCVAFLLENLRNGRGLLAVYKSAIPGTLDGYAYLLWALLETYHSTLNSRWLDEARSLGGLMVETFSGENGMLYYTAPDCDDLPIRGVNAHDGATPSGQSVAAHCMLRLSRLTGDAFWEEWYDSLTRSLSEAMEANPEAYAWMAAALLHAENGGIDVTLAPGGHGPRQASGQSLSAQEPPSGSGLHTLLAALRGFHPFMTVRLDETSTDGPLAKAYVCRDNTCMAPVTDAAMLGRILSSPSPVS
ncbi:MAG: thioredoxin domain-containing protein [Oscillospiraceae bacterium]|nr:thioredoxin domain-containing protein [Oscillospiraceae bacterium]